MAQNPRSEERNPTHDMREATRRGAEQAERVARATADVNGQAARTGSDIMARNVKTAHEMMQSGAEMAARLAERSAHGVNRAFGLSGEEAQRAAQSSTGNLSALMRSSAMLAELTQDMALEWMHFNRERMEQNLDRFDHLLNSRNPQDLLALQSELMRSNLEGLWGFTRKAAERSIEMAEELTRNVSESAERSRRAA
jgi:hypothetical protein